MNYPLPVTDDQRHLLTETVRAVQPHAEALADFFYAHLLSVLPALAPTIHLNRMTQQRQLMCALELTVQYAFNGYSHPESDIRSGLWNLGQRPAMPPLWGCHYQVAGEAMLYAFEQVLKDEFPPEARAAWQIIIQGAARIADMAVSA